MTFISTIVDTFLANKQLADKAVAQVSDDCLHRTLDNHTNSIAIIMKHVSGNLSSRWTEFLTTDGEKPTRDRDSEFIDTFSCREDLLDHWEQGWTCLLSSLSELTDDDMGKTVKIRGESQTAGLALARSLGHTCYHIGQIVQLSRHYADKRWTTLTIARGASKQYNQQNWGTSGKSHS